LNYKTGAFVLMSAFVVILVVSLMNILRKHK